MDSIFSLISPELLVFAFAVTLVAGIVKGAIGFAMPLIMISGMGILIDPKLVVAGIILPIVMSNILQIAKAGWAEARDSLREYGLYILIVCVMILITSQFVAYVSADAMLLGLGIVVTVLCIIQISGVRLHIKPENRRIGSISLVFSLGHLVDLQALGDRQLCSIWSPSTHPKHGNSSSKASSTALARSC